MACAALRSLRSSTLMVRSTAGLVTPPFIFSASSSPRPPHGRSKKRLRTHLHIDTTPCLKNPWQWEDQPQEQQLAPQAQKFAEIDSSVNGEAYLKSIMSGPCCVASQGFQVAEPGTSEGECYLPSTKRIEV